MNVNVPTSFNIDPLVMNSKFTNPRASTKNLREGSVVTEKTDIHRIDADPFVFKNESLVHYTRQASKTGSQASIDLGNTLKKDMKHNTEQNSKMNLKYRTNQDNLIMNRLHQKRTESSQMASRLVQKSLNASR